MKRKDFIESYFKKNSIKKDILGCNYNIDVELNDKEMSIAVDELQLKINQSLEKMFADNSKRLAKLEVVNLLGDNSLRKDFFEDKFFLSLNIMKIYDYLNDRFGINKEITKIYRIECEGNGIYSYLSSINKPLSDKFYFDEIGQPSPREDEHLPAICSSMNNYIDNKKVKYACDSKEQLISWFPKEMIKYIQEHAPNAKIVEYEIEDSKVLASTKQAAFISGTEVKIKEFQIEEWFNFENKKKLKIK